MALLFDRSESGVKPSALPELAAASEIVLDPFSESDVRPSDRAGACRLPPFTVWPLFEHRCFFPSWPLALASFGNRSEILHAYDSVLQAMPARLNVLYADLP